MNNFRILALGDVVGPSTVNYIGEHLWTFRKENKINMVVCNAENASAGNGLLPQTADDLLSSGCDVLTSGNHIFRKKEIKQYIENSRELIRPANYPAGTPGNGYTIAKIDGYSILVMNMLGTVYMEAMSCPFRGAEAILDREEGKYDFSVLDFHAEATGEKGALGMYLDGRVNVIYGTHTHIPTADMRILPKGSGFVSDLGMCGPQDGVLGVRADIIIDKLMTKMPVRFDLATGAPSLNGVIFSIDTDTKKVTAVDRVKF